MSEEKNTGTKENDTIYFSLEFLFLLLKKILWLNSAHVNSTTLDIAHVSTCIDLYPSIYHLYHM